MGLIKPGDNGKAKGRIAPPPSGVVTSVKVDQAEPHAFVHNAGNRMAAQNLLNAIIKSPEMAGRFTTHGEFKDAVAQDFDYYINLLKSKGYWSAD